MRNQARIQALVRSFLAECAEGFVGAWAILWEVKQSFPSLDEGQRKATTLEIVRQLLATQEVVVGDFDDEKRFCAWSVGVPRDAVLEEVERRWTSLGREPDIGEVAWLTQRQQPQSDLG